MARIWLIALSGFATMAFGLQADEVVDGTKPGNGVINPAVISKPEPAYTAEAKAEHIQGNVLLQIVVDQQGRATQISVISPLGFGLDEAAADAVSRWRFHPGTKDGKPVKVLARIQVSFRLTNANTSFNEKAEKQRTAYNLALGAVQQNKVTKATIDSLSDLASQKYPPGMYLFGKVLEGGRGVAANPEEGFRLIQESAEKKYGPGIYEVAIARIKGERLDKDEAKGLDLMRSAARLGSRGAELYLGEAYEKGEGVPVDSEKSRQNYRLCAAMGDAPCEFGLGKSLLQHSDHPDRDYVQAIAWLELASDQGVGDAEKLLEQEDARLTPAQVAGARQLKGQLVHK